MAIGRTEDRDTPGNPVMLRHREYVRDPVRVIHLGQRSNRPRTQAGHMSAIDQTHSRCQTLQTGGRPHMGSGFAAAVWPGQMPDGCSGTWLTHHDGMEATCRGRSMPWQEVSVMDQRREFVWLARQDGANRRGLCRRFGISPDTGYRLIARSVAGETIRADPS